MLRKFPLLAGLFLLCVQAGWAEDMAKTSPAHKPVRVSVISVRDEIGEPVHYILRRGLKENADVVVLDMDTLGGSAGAALEMMQALTKFSGTTITFIDDKAMSAGAFIASATSEIWFAPGAKIGAAAPVTSEGQDIPETMRLKMISFLKVSVRSVSEGKGYRSQVLSAMIDKDYELKIGDKVIKPKGELLSLTAHEANETYGEPPQKLLAAGIAKDLDDLLAQKFGAGNYTVTKFIPTWSESLAQWLNAISPILMGLGMLALFIEFKTPGFGVFGISGIVLLAIVFLGHYVAGLSGHEPILVFALGLVLLTMEILFFPGVVVLALSGVIMILGSLIWSMADLWPNEPLRVAWSADAFTRPVASLGLGVAIAVILGAALARFLPRGWVWDKLVLSSSVNATAQMSGGAPDASTQIETLIGRRGIAATALRPGGQVEIDGKRYEARVAIEAIDAGMPVIVRGRTDFALIVEKADA